MLHNIFSMKNRNSNRSSSKHSTDHQKTVWMREQMLTYILLDQNMFPLEFVAEEKFVQTKRKKRTIIQRNWWRSKQIELYGYLHLNLENKSVHIQIDARQYEKWIVPSIWKWFDYHSFDSKLIDNVHGIKGPLRIDDDPFLLEKPFFLFFLLKFSFSALPNRWAETLT